MTARLADGVVDHSFEKDDAILEEQVAQGHLTLSRIIAIALKRRIGERRFKRHGTVLRNQGPVDRGPLLENGRAPSDRARATSRGRSNGPVARWRVHDPSSDVFRLSCVGCSRPAIRPRAVGRDVQGLDLALGLDRRP